MNIFQMTTGPYLLVLVVSILGWQVNAISTELTSANAASFHVKVYEPEKMVGVQLQNLSRKNAMRNVRFSLVCRSSVSPCFGATGSQQNLFDQTNIIAYSPVAPTATKIAVISADEVTIRTDLPSGAMVEVRAPYAAADPDFVFYYVADTPVARAEAKEPADRQSEIFLVEANSLLGLLLANYVDILIFSLLAASAVVVIWIVLGLFSLFFRKAKAEVDNEEKFYRIVLSRDNRRPAGGGTGPAPGKAGGANGGNVKRRAQRRPQ